jgi:Protein of unknown function (DUF2637)
VPDRVIRITTALVVVGVAVVAAIVSYEHAYALVRARGEAGWTARLVPLTVDGLIYSSSMVLLQSARRQARVPALALWLLGLGILATLASLLVGAAQASCGVQPLGELPASLNRNVRIDRYAPGMSRCHAGLIHHSRSMLRKHSSNYLRDISMSRCHASDVPTHPELTLVPDWGEGPGKCLDCGAPSGRRQRCTEHHARHAAKLAAERQRRRRADQRTAKPSTESALGEAADLLMFELASLWAHPELPAMDTYQPVLRAAAGLLKAFRDRSESVDSK